MAKKVINSNNPIFSMDENFFDAVGILKSETDKADEFYVHRINNGRLNGGSDYDFKSSCQMALLALKMDVNNEEDTGLQEENAFLMQCTCKLLASRAFGYV